MKKVIEIDGRKIGENNPVYIVAEMSANHNGDYDRAVEILHAAKEAGADAVKIQTYTADTITLNSDKPYFQITQGTLWDGRTLYDLYKEAYTPWEWHAPLLEEAKKIGITLFSSPFDLTAVDYLEDLNVPCYKIASFEITDIPMIRKIAKLGKPIIFATGIAYEKDIKLALDTCKEEGNENIILLKCTSAYPAPFEAVNLEMIPFLADRFDCVSGLSDHTMGYSVATASVAKGAKMIEKHMTLKRSDGGADSAFSMEPEEFKEMCTGIRQVEKALGKVGFELSEKQIREREHTRSLFVSSDIKAGEIFSENNIRSIRPGYGLHTRYYEEILGRKALADLEAGTPLDWKYIEGFEDRANDDCPAYV
ncbi:MAG: pseudaminic acid synthase [Lachnospiraceae bacterium]|nr:pseudaminic acid synthase [Lachnospiraceae bacterium]